jgi:virulence-associated protein VagC
MFRHVPGEAGDGTARQTVSERANQAVRIPREFELPGSNAIMRKQGDRLILEPAPKHSIDRLLAALATLEYLARLAGRGRQPCASAGGG